MKTVLRWGLMYLLLLTGLTALGHYNQHLNTRLVVLQANESNLKQKETRLLLQRYQLTAPLALRTWAEANGYIPMSLGRWVNPAQETERSAP